MRIDRQPTDVYEELARAYVFNSIRELSQHMVLASGLKRWKEAISLALLCIVWIFLGSMNGGLSTPNTPYEISLSS